MPNRANSRRALVRLPAARERAAPVVVLRLPKVAFARLVVGDVEDAARPGGPVRPAPVRREGAEEDEPPGRRTHGDPSESVRDFRREAAVLIRWQESLPVFSRREPEAAVFL